MTETDARCVDGHAWQLYNSEQIAELRRQARPGRPSGAWVEGAKRCEQCSSVIAQVTWLGEGFEVPVTSEGGSVKVHWPRSTGERRPGQSGMSMG